MKYLTAIFSFIILLILFSCKSDERIIDNSDVKWKMLAATGGNTPGLMVVEMPAGTILSNDVFFENNNKYLPGNVTKIKDFLQKLYLLIPSKNIILVLDKDTYQLIDSVDFSQEGLEPFDMCFANATDAYVAQGNDTIVSLLDLTNYQIAKSIKVGKHPVAIACSGNQIFVANQEDNTVSIIDSRTDNVEALINVKKVPSYIDISPDGEKAIVISLGAGKLAQGETKTSAYATFITTVTHQIAKEKELKISGIDAAELIPQGISITEGFFAYIPSQTILMRLDVRQGERIDLVEMTNYQSAIYNYIRDEVILLKEESGAYKAVILNAVKAKQQGLFSFPVEVNFILPL